MVKLHRIMCTLTMVLVTTAMTAADIDSVMLVRENPAHAFGETIPAGNYSGIVNVEGNTYALVSDKGTRGEVVFVATLLMHVISIHCPQESQTTTMRILFTLRIRRRSI